MITQLNVKASLFVLIFLFSSVGFAQENWTRFHGPNGTGLAEKVDLPREISDDHYLWKVQLPGNGSSSPVIWKDKVFITSFDRDSTELKLQCLSAETGKELWSKSFEFPPYKVHSRNSYASSTPAVDENHVYVSFGNPKHVMLVAVDHNGTGVWERDFGTWQSQHGYSASPMIYQDKVVLYNSQQGVKLRPGTEPGVSRLIAVKSSDGTDVWEMPLKTTRACYAVPSVFTDAKGKDQLVSCNTGDGFFGVDPETGEQLWTLMPFKMRTVASTLITDGLIIGSNGSGGGGNYLVAIRPDQNGEKLPEKAYEIQRANYVPTPVAVDGKLILFTDKGIGRCFDLQSGSLHWEKRISKGFSGSPVSADGLVYVMDEDGTLHVISAKETFEQVAKHELGEPSRATPAIAGKRMFLRTESQLICVGK